MCICKLRKIPLRSPLDSELTYNEILHCKEIKPSHLTCNVSNHVLLEREIEFIIKTNNKIIIQNSKMYIIILIKAVILWYFHGKDMWTVNVQFSTYCTCPLINQKRFVSWVQSTVFNIILLIEMNGESTAD